MRIRFIGQKGIPARFGGVEAHVESLAQELAGRGHDVAVYVRPWYTPRELESYRGVRLVHVPTLNTKHADAAVHSFLCSVQAIFSDADIIHYHAIGPAFFSILPRLFGKKVVVTVHRQDWQAAKWGPVARLLLKAGEHVSVKVPHRTIVVSAELQDHIRTKYGKETVHIAHGRSRVEPAEPRTITRKYSLRGQDYILFLGRLSPEKRVDWLLDSYREMKKSSPRSRGVKLVLAGGSSATDDYVRTLKKSRDKDPDIIFTGNVTGREKSELLTNALVFVLPSSLEGSPVALLEAFGLGLCCLASDIPPHREAIRSGADGLLFKHNDRADLTRQMTRLVCDRARRQRLGRAAKAKVSRAPGWKEVARRHEMLYNEIAPEAAARLKRKRPD